ALRHGLGVLRIVLDELQAGGADLVAGAVEVEPDQLGYGEGLLSLGDHDLDVLALLDAAAGGRGDGDDMTGRDGVVELLPRADGQAGGGERGLGVRERGADYLRDGRVGAGTGVEVPVPAHPSADGEGRDEAQRGEQSHRP